MGNIERLDVPQRCFVYNEEVVESFVKEYKYFPEGVRLLKAATQEAANISDVFCMLPVCLFYVADQVSVARFLIGEKDRDKGLFIPTFAEKFSKEQDMLGARLGNLVKTGFLMKISYQASPGHYVTVYSAPKETVELVSKKLDRRIYPELWTSETPEYRIIGRACSGMVASYLSRHANFRMLEKGLCSFRVSSTMQLPEFNFINSEGKDFLVGFYYAFLHRDERIHSEGQYVRSVVVGKIIFCEEYITFRSKIKEKEANLIIAVEDSEDLMKFAKALRQMFLSPDKSPEEVKRNKEKLKHIYFTGEGMFMTASDAGLKQFEGLFFRLNGDGRLEENVTPEFLL